MFDYPVQITVVMFMDFGNAMIDIVICACFPKKIRKPLQETDEQTSGSGQSDNVSEVSSVRSDQRVELKVKKR